jgi:hypothetical protein
MHVVQSFSSSWFSAREASSSRNLPAPQVSQSSTLSWSVGLAAFAL